MAARLAQVGVTLWAVLGAVRAESTEGACKAPACDAPATEAPPGMQSAILEDEEWATFAKASELEQFVNTHSSASVVVGAFVRDSDEYRAFAEGIAGMRVPLPRETKTLSDIPVAVLLCTTSQDCEVPSYRLSAPGVASVEQPRADLEGSRSSGGGGTYVGHLKDDVITAEGTREFATLALVPPVVSFFESNAWQEFIRANLGGEQRLAALVFDEGSVCDTSRKLHQELVDAARHVRGLALVLGCGPNEAPAGLGRAFGVDVAGNAAPSAVVFDVSTKTVYPLAAGDEDAQALAGDAVWAPARIDAVSLRRHVELAATNELPVVPAWQTMWEGERRAKAMQAVATSGKTFRGMPAAHDGLWEDEGSGSAVREATA